MSSTSPIEMQSYDFLFKMILIGDSGTGKTCLLHHFVYGEFKEESQHTIGVEFSSKVLRVGKTCVKLQLWDTAGQERFRSVTRSYYRGACACLLVYDITKRATFDPLSRWLADARSLASSDLVVVLVGNKLDRAEDEREVAQEEAERWARDNGALHLETSSLSGENVETPFHLAAKSILLSIESGSIDPEKPGSGISYGDRGVGGSMSIRSGFSTMGLGNGRGFDSRFDLGREGGRLKGLKERMNGCCNT
ncbi:ras-domain-containing protein [Ceraceosorus guamensis]|uniref:Ras-domain-containing protein n=1 Tax=Ceraceosorus guamensis TaxID=1522189 RepID=A0A316VXW6_9BASI|nr:ras-domain-containing protein [Ceraceosorus guamensis]PWN40315.1 ras-domain-containing protein [Ceraceosorus guamensis]